MKKVIAGLLVGATILGSSVLSFASPLTQCPTKCANCKSTSIRCELNHREGSDWLEWTCRKCGWSDCDIM